MRAADVRVMEVWVVAGSLLGVLLDIWRGIWIHFECIDFVEDTGDNVYVHREAQGCGGEFASSS